MLGATCPCSQCKVGHVELPRQWIGTKPLLLRQQYGPVTMAAMPHTCLSARHGHSVRSGLALHGFTQRNCAMLCSGRSFRTLLWSCSFVISCQREIVTRANSRAPVQEMRWSVQHLPIWEPIYIAGDRLSRVALKPKEYESHAPCCSLFTAVRSGCHTICRHGGNILADCFNEMSATVVDEEDSGAECGPLNAMAGCVYNLYLHRDPAAEL